MGVNTHEVIGIDSFGNKILNGEPIMVSNGKFFVKNLLTNEHMEMLDVMGVTEEIAGAENIDMNSKREDFLEGMRDAENDRYDQIEEDARREIDEPTNQNS